MLPLSLPEHWYDCARHLEKISDRQAQDWVKSESSLTVRIKELGIAFNVELLQQTTQSITAKLRGKLETADQQGLFREVLLKQGHTPLVYAQTIMPESTVTGTERVLAELGNQSLGQVLFQTPQAIRSEIEFAQVLPGSPLGQYIQQSLEQEMERPCYMRRSLFHLKEKPLLVCECFLPELFS